MPRRHQDKTDQSSLSIFIIIVIFLIILLSLFYLVIFQPTYSAKKHLTLCIHQVEKWENDCFGVCTTNRDNKPRYCKYDKYRESSGYINEEHCLADVAIDLRYCTIRCRHAKEIDANTCTEEFETKSPVRKILRALHL